MNLRELTSSIKAKLLLVTAGGTLLVLAAAGTGMFLQSQAIQQLSTEVAALESQRVQLTDARVAFSEQQREWKNAVVFGRLADSSEEHWNNFLHHEKRVLDSMQSLHGRGEAAALKGDIEDFQAKHAALGERSRKLRELYMQYFDLDGVMSSARGMDVEADKKLAEIVASLSQTIVARRDQIIAAAPTAVRVSVALMAGACSVAFVLFLWLLQAHIARPLRQMGEAVNAVAKGDLSEPFTSQRRDEIGAVIRDVEHMRLRFIEMLGEIRDSAESIDIVTAEITAGTRDLSLRTEQTASNLQETSSSMNQLGDTVRRSTDSARTADDLAGTAFEAAQRGGSVVSRVVDTMNAISGSSRKIADIIGVIDGIAFQTNILALNAAVEAARAGEQGRGFAVVAGEVRALAQRSAQAAKEIKDLISSSSSNVEAGAKLVEGAGSTMGEIVQAVQKVSQVIVDITAAAGEQSEGIARVGHTVSSVDQMTQQNSALVEQSNAAAESLQEQARKLVQIVHAFKLAADAGDARAAHDSAQAPDALPDAHVGTEDSLEAVAA